MITNVEVLVNEYWMYPDEPFHLIRFMCDGERYLFGKENHNSLSVEKSRGDIYKEPIEEMIERVLDELEGVIERG